MISPLLPTTQAEAGYKYDLTMELVPTQCLKNDAGTRDVELSQCPLAPPSERQVSRDPCWGGDGHRHPPGRSQHHPERTDWDLERTGPDPAAPVWTRMHTHTHTQPRCPGHTHPPTQSPSIWGTHTRTQKLGFCDMCTRVHTEPRCPGHTHPQRTQASGGHMCTSRHWGCVCPPTHTLVHTHTYLLGPLSPHVPSSLPRSVSPSLTQSLLPPTRP